MKENERVSLLNGSEWLSARKKYYTPNQGMDLKQATQVLFEVDDILRSINAPFFLSCGTALGLYRDNNFIEWDDEIDVDILAEFFLPNLKIMQKEFIKKGFIARATDRGVTSKMSVFKNKIKVAMGSLYDNQQGFRCDHSQKYPKSFYENPEKFNFKGRDFLMPGPVDKYLTWYYGNWKVPVKSYNPTEYLNSNNQWRK